MNDRAETVIRGLQPSETAPSAAQRRHFHWLPWTVAAVVAVALAALAWAHFARGPTVSYTTDTVTRGAVTRTVTATGTVNPELTIIVGSYVSGVIQSLSCDYNTEVKAGQVCAKIDPRPYQAALDQYAGQLARDQALLEKDRANLARYQTLAAQNSIARQQAEDQVYLVHQDEGTVKLDQSLVESAKLNLGYTDIVSPVDGTVVSRNVTQGQTVAASFQTPTLFLIATDLKKMEVDTNTSESDIGTVKEGQNANFTVDAYPDRIFRGQVTQVRQSPQTVQNVVTYDAVVGIDNHDFALKPGMTASTQIIVDQRTDVLRVPDQGLRYAAAALGGSANGVQHVFVMRGGKPVAVPVQVGLDDGNFSEIVSGGLSAGDRVITAERSDAAGGNGLPPPRL
ncbi:MAG TPA: efflux RND transporter periplasmic adaptor subunit [Stellaceae bacterium]|nr:efflux RND transporter periplasmic adaptor subunit [Stellaceae bacterium]